MTRELIGAATVALILFLLAGIAYSVWPSSPEKAYIHKPAKDHTALAYRINHACKPGYYVVDWTAGDEWRPMPRGVISVTCGARDDDNYTVYTVAIAR